MKKIIEVEYVGIEDVQDIMDDAMACMREGHYVIVSISGSGGNTLVSVTITLKGSNEVDYVFTFFMGDNCNYVAEMNKCKATLKNLLVGVDE